MIPNQMLPSEFIHQCGRTLPSLVHLQGPRSAKVWPVRYIGRPARNTGYFMRGWKDFLVGNSLKKNDHLTFTLTKASHFAVTYHWAQTTRLHLEDNDDDVPSSMCASVRGTFLFRVGQDPSGTKSNRLHVDILRFCCHSFKVYSIDSSKMIGNSLEISNFNQLFFKLSRFICN